MLSALIGKAVVKAVFKGLDVDVSGLGMPDWLTEILF